MGLKKMNKKQLKILNNKKYDSNFINKYLVNNIEDVLVEENNNCKIVWRNISEFFYYNNLKLSLSLEQSIDIKEFNSDRTNGPLDIYVSIVDRDGKNIKKYKYKQILKSMPEFDNKKNNISKYLDLQVKKYKHLHLSNEFKKFLSENNLISKPDNNKTEKVNFDKDLIKNKLNKNVSHINKKDKVLSNTKTQKKMGKKNKLDKDDLKKKDKVLLKTKTQKKNELINNFDKDNLKKKDKVSINKKPIVNNVNESNIKRYLDNKNVISEILGFESQSSNSNGIDNDINLIVNKLEKRISENEKESIVEIKNNDNSIDKQCNYVYQSSNSNDKDNESDFKIVLNEGGDNNENEDKKDSMVDISNNEINDVKKNDNNSDTENEFESVIVSSNKIKKQIHLAELKFNIGKIQTRLSRKKENKRYKGCAIESNEMIYNLVSNNK